MKRFGYAFDPLCLLACAGYALNRWWLRQRVGGEFLQGYFNDLLLIPAALPLVLWLQRRLGLRADDHRPRWSEIALHLVVWASFQHIGILSLEFHVDKLSRPLL